jgi:hypothetical protein
MSVFVAVLALDFAGVSAAIAGVENGTHASAVMTRKILLIAINSSADEAAISTACLT